VGEPLFAIAEIGLNHGGSPAEALALVDAAARAGASAVKLQTLRADALVAGHCPAPAHVEARSLRDFFRQFELDEEAHRAVAARARMHGLAFMSTPFDLDAVEMLERVGVDAFKIASGDLTFVSLIRRVAATGTPVVLSTGMSTLDETAAAVLCAGEAGARQIAVLHCVSSYPAPAGSENLSAIATLARALDVPVGLSDHGATPEAAAIAVTLGASIYERHFVADTDSTAIDRAVSSTPEELAASLNAAERARRALGDGLKVCLPAEAVNVRASRRGLYAARPLRAGQVVAPGDLIALRPADGIEANLVDLVVGARLERDLGEGVAIQWADLPAIAKGLRRAV
jgi:sialic acid synthase SpsE